MLLLISKDLR